MKWGIVYASTSFPEPDRAVAMATAAEAAGFESLWCPEHVVVPVGRDATPYRGSLDGKMDRVWRRGGLPDPLIWLAFVASHTTTIQLGTNVVIVPEHQPAVLAKSVATLDALSGGRVQLGVGVGELPEEYGAVGMEFTNRGQRMDEYLEAMRLLWEEEVASYHGQFVAFDQVRCDPSPPGARCPSTSVGRHRRPSGGPSASATATSRTSGRSTTSFPSFAGFWPTLTPSAIGWVATSTRSRSQSAAPAPPRRRRPWPNSVSTAARSPSAKEMPEVRDELARFGTEVIEPTKVL